MAIALFRYGSADSIIVLYSYSDCTHSFIRGFFAKKKEQFFSGKVILF